MPSLAASTPAAASSVGIRSPRRGARRGGGGRRVPARAGRRRSPRLGARRAAWVAWDPLVFRSFRPPVALHVQTPPRSRQLLIVSPRFSNRPYSIRVSRLQVQLALLGLAGLASRFVWPARGAGATRLCQVTARSVRRLQQVPTAAGAVIVAVVESGDARSWLAIVPARSRWLNARRQGRRSRPDPVGGRDSSSATMSVSTRSSIVGVVSE